MDAVQGIPNFNKGDGQATVPMSIKLSDSPQLQVLQEPQEQQQELIPAPITTQIPEVRTREGTNYTIEQNREGIIKITLKGTLRCAKCIACNKDRCTIIFGQSSRKYADCGLCKELSNRVARCTEGTIEFLEQFFPDHPHVKQTRKKIEEARRDARKKEKEEIKKRAQQMIQQMKQQRKQQKKQQEAKKRLVQSLSEGLNGIMTTTQNESMQEGQVDPTTPISSRFSSPEISLAELFEQEQTKRRKMMENEENAMTTRRSSTPHPSASMTMEEGMEEISSSLSSSRSNSPLLASTTLVLDNQQHQGSLETSQTETSLPTLPSTTPPIKNLMTSTSIQTISNETRPTNQTESTSGLRNRIEDIEEMMAAGDDDAKTLLRCTRIAIRGLKRDFPN